MRTAPMKLGIAKDIIAAWQAGETLCLMPEGMAEPENEVKEYAGPPGLIMRTSGTTGKSKLVVVPWAAMEARCQSAAKKFNITSSTVTASLKPAFMIPECFSIVLETARQGGRVLLLDEIKANPSLLSEAHLLLSMPTASFPPLNTEKSPLQYVIFGTLASDDDHYKATTAWAPQAKVVTWYGSREMGGISVTDGENFAQGLVGKPLPGVEVRIVDDVLEVRSSQMCYGYIGRPLTLNDGWFVTEDFAEIKEDGSIILKGRRTPRAER